LIPFSFTFSVIVLLPERKRKIKRTENDSKKNLSDMKSHRLPRHLVLLRFAAPLRAPARSSKVASQTRSKSPPPSRRRKVRFKTLFKALLTTPTKSRVMLEANADANCAGLILWMHTFRRRRCGSGGAPAC